MPHHCFVVLLYKQPTELCFNETKITNKQGKERTKFSIKKFAEKYTFGKPYAGTFFEADYDDTVPEIWKSLGYKL